ncbi:MAG: BON domain-containing protein [Thermoanaerobaculia bacterium]
MPYRNDRGEFGGDYARDTHRGGLSDDYARDGGWSGAGRADDYAREPWRPSYRGRGPKNWRRSDEAIVELVNERLTDHDDVDATDIEVTVENGEVTLSGMVTNRREKRIAEDVAWACGGVHDVHNRLRIGDREPHIGKASE